MPGERTYLVLDETERAAAPVRPRRPRRGCRAPRRPRGGPTPGPRSSSPATRRSRPSRPPPRSTGRRADRLDRPGRRRGRQAVGADSSAASPVAIHEVVAHRCACGLPDVVTTPPRLPIGTPVSHDVLPHLPRAASLIGTLEGSGDHEGDAGPARHRPRPSPTCVRRGARALPAPTARTALPAQDVPEIDGISAGGMPDRVKCLHVLAAHALAVGTGTNPLGDAVLDRVGAWWAAGPCVPRGAG